MKKKDRKLYDSWKYKKGSFMEFNNPIFQTLLGLVIFYIGLKMFSGGMKSMSHLEHLEWFLESLLDVFRSNWMYPSLAI